MTKQGLLLMMTDIDPANEEDFNRWYEEEHLPDRATCPGFLTARRELEGAQVFAVVRKDVKHPNAQRHLPPMEQPGEVQSAVIRAGRKLAVQDYRLRWDK